MFEGISGAILLAILDYLYIFVVLGGLAILMVIVGKIVKKYEIKEEEKNDDHLIAIITAAISSCLEKPKSRFKVVNIKKYRTSSMTPWSAMGRQELMSGRK